MDKIQELENKINYLETQTKNIYNELERTRFELISLKGIQPNNVVNNIQQPQVQQNNIDQQIQQAIIENSNKNKNNFERIIGRNAMGIGASILIFIAMIMFATLLLPYLGDEVKLVAMYVFSFLLIGFGEFIYRKQKNGYLILSACGIGALFISIVATNVYFHYINNIVLYLLLILWIGYTSYLGKKRNLLFVIVGQLGIFMSLVLACFGMETAMDLYLTFIYLIISELLFFGLFYNAGYKFYLTNIIGLCISIFTFNLGVLIRYNIYPAELTYHSGPIIPMIVLLSILFIYLGIGYFLYKSNSKDKLILSGIISFINSLNVLSICGFLAFSREFSFEPRQAHDIYYFVPLVIYYLLLTVFFIIKEHKFNKIALPFEYIGLGLFLLSSCALPEWLNYIILLLTYLAIVGYNIILNRVDFYYVSQCILCFMIIIFTGKELIILPIIILLINICQMIYSRLKNEQGKLIGYEMFSYVSLLILCSTIIFTIFNKNDAIFGLSTSFIESIILAGVFLLIQLLVIKFNWANNRGNFKFRFGVNLALMIFLLIGYIEEGLGDNLPCIIIYSLFTIAIFSINLKSLLQYNNKAGAYIGLKYTLLIWVILSTLKVSGQAFSVILLLIAIASILCGFMIKNKSIRLYGLVLSMFSIFKLIVYDISYDNTLMRAISFLICGILCFVISLIYNYIDKKQNVLIEKDDENYNI